MINKTAYIALGILLILNGCVHLKGINDYSEKSVNNLKKFEESGYSFSISCEERCEGVQLEKKQLSRSLCECADERSADSVTQAIYRAVKGYFEGLSKLSDNQLTNYKFSSLAKAIKEGDFAGMKINRSHVDAYAKISSILTRAVSDGYRKNKLSKYVAEANEPVKLLLDALEYNIVANLSRKLDIKLERIKSIYSDLSVDPSLSAYEKVQVIKDFNKITNETAARKKMLIAYGKGLHTIAEGHQQLFENRSRLKSKQLLELLIQYSSDLQDIVEEINTLKN